MKDAKSSLGRALEVSQALIDFGIENKFEPGAMITGMCVTLAALVDLDKPDAVESVVKLFRFQVEQVRAQRKRRQV